MSTIFLRFSQFLQTWDRLRVLIGDSSKMKTRLKQKDLSDIKPEALERARSYLMNVDRAQVHYTSETAETFFAWVLY